MKKFLLGVLIIFLSGCSTIEVPNYIKDKHPYDKTFYADFDRVLSASIGALEDMGWKLGGRTQPSVYEQTRVEGAMEETEEIMLYTESHYFPFFIGTSYSKVNIFLTRVDKNTTDFQVRFIKVTSFLFKNFYSYQQDRFVSKLFKNIQMKLGQN